MAVISNSTFDALSRRVNVRLQQGVPIVDADWNELDDIRKFELQAFIKWFVGDGVPFGNDGFHIAALPAPPPPNDFLILAGISGPPNGLTNVGRILVNGSDVIIAADSNFSAQPLHVSQGAAADAESAKQGVPKIAALTTPAADGLVTAYLDVYERLVTPTEDPSLVLPGLGTESSARTKREWAVRTRSGNHAPLKGDPDFIAGHSYYALATIARRAGDNAINPGDVTDLREQQLMTPPATLINDLFGTSMAAYRRGQGRPAISLRDVINALIHGEVPSTPDAAISPGPGLNILKRGWMFDNTNGLVALWTSDRIGGVNQILSARLDVGNLAGGFSTARQNTTGGPHSDPSAAILPNGDFILTYTSGLGPGSDVFMRRAPLSGLSGAAEQPVAATAGIGESQPFVLVSGNVAVFFYFRADPGSPLLNRWQFRRFRHTDNTWIDAGPIAIPTANGNADPALTQFNADLDPAGNIWLAFQQGIVNTAIGAMRLVPATGVIDNPIFLDSSPQADVQPYVLCLANGDVNVFWHGATALFQSRFSSGGWQAAFLSIPNTNGAPGGDNAPVAVEESGGGVWLFWTHGPPPTEDIFFMRRSPDTGAWGQPRQMTLSPNDDTTPAVLIGPNNALYVVWSSDRTGNVQPYFKRLITAW